jgi:type IV secretory pathway TraG/TraD family ATPase VirD4
VPAARRDSGLLAAACGSRRSGAARRFSTLAAREALRRGGALRFAGTLISLVDETKHFRIIGTTGTGKSTAFRELLQGALGRGDRAVFADPDFEYVARFHEPARGDVILNPFDPRSVRWDLYAELRAPYDYDQLARSLIGEGTGSEKAWRAYAQTFFAALLRQTHEAGVHETAEFYRLLTSAPLEELRTLLAGTPTQRFLEVGNERVFASMRAVASAATTALDYVLVQGGVAFSIRRWVEEGRGLLFPPYRADQVAALRSVISTWMRIAIFQTMRQVETDHRLWFVTDKLDALARLRKFGGRCVLGFQSIARVSGLYGESESQTIVENCGNTLILRRSASEGGGTALFASRLIGERELIREKQTRIRGGNLLERRRISVSRMVEHVVEHAVMPSEIEQLPVPRRLPEARLATGVALPAAAGTEVGRPDPGGWRTPD